MSLNDCREWELLSRLAPSTRRQVELAYESLRPQAVPSVNQLWRHTRRRRRWFGSKRAGYCPPAQPQPHTRMTAAAARAVIKAAKASVPRYKSTCY